MNPQADLTAMTVRELCEKYAAIRLPDPWSRPGGSWPDDEREFEGRKAAIIAELSRRTAPRPGGTPEEEILEVCPKCSRKTLRTEKRNGGRVCLASHCWHHEPAPTPRPEPAATATALAEDLKAIREAPDSDFPKAVLNGRGWLRHKLMMDKLRELGFGDAVDEYMLPVERTNCGPAR
jgi:hypothetical protein